MTPDIDKIVAGLSEAQRDAVLGIYSFASPYEEDDGEARLYQLGLWKTYRIHSGETHWTDLGLAVRAYLRTQGEQP